MSLPGNAGGSETDLPHSSSDYWTILEQERSKLTAAGLDYKLAALEPEEHFLYNASLPPELHDALVQGLTIAPDHISSDALEEFRTIQDRTPVTLIGWNHTEKPSHALAADMIRQIQDTTGTTICVEYPSSYQAAIDLYLAKGVFREGDNPDLYESIYHYDFINSGEIPTDLKGTYFDEFSVHDSWGILELYEVLKAAREKGLRVRTIDERHELSDPKRDKEMADRIAEETAGGKKVVALLGKLHTNRNGFDYDGVHYTSTEWHLRDLFRESQVRSWSLQSDDNNLGASPGEITRSVLYDVVRRASPNSPHPVLHVSPKMFPNTPESVSKAIGSNYYIPVFSLP